MKHIIRYIFAVLSFVAFMPVAIAQDDVSQVHATKTATSNGDGSYTLTLESFVEGEAHEEVVETQPADIILVMKDGHIIETGNHESLMKKQGFYYEMYSSQYK